jgi:hypothetical protein
MHNEDRSTRIESKIDLMAEKISDIQVTLGKQHVTLEEHTRRSLANEKAVEILQARLEPVETYQKIQKALLKIVGLLLSSEILYITVRYLFKIGA